MQSIYVFCNPLCENLSILFLQPPLQYLVFSLLHTQPSFLSFPRQPMNYIKQYGLRYFLGGFLVLPYTANRTCKSKKRTSCDCTLRSSGWVLCSLDRVLHYPLSMLRWHCLISSQPLLSIFLATHKAKVDGMLSGM